ncbi:hypothetical protein BC831DRAFT_449118 [Entophlyctis helioformis]|nr:hypothetical protein BC831DRAFT_449118 [Entophlyctis helioformis]
MDLAARDGHLSTVQWLHEHRTEGCTEWAVTYAALNSNLPMVEWLLAHRPADGLAVHAFGCHDERIARVLRDSLTKDRRLALLQEAEKLGSAGKLMVDRLSRP